MTTINENRYATTESVLPGPWPEPSLDRVEPLEELSVGQRLTRRQQTDIGRGVHPLRRGPLHERAPRDIDKTRRNARFTCGSCAHRFQQSGGYNGTFPKCEIAHIAGSVHTDCRAWWPACTDYAPVDGRPS